MSVGLVVEIIGDASKLGKELDKSEGSVNSWAGGIGGAAVKVAAIAGVASIAAVAIASMTDAAVEDQAEQARLEATLKAAGVATGNYTAKVEDAIAAGQERAFTDTQTREALASLVTATGDLDAATSELAAAQDIARFANVDLATAADAVAKAHAGQDGALRKLMPGLAKGASATDTLAEATALAAGQADTYAGSAKGMQDRAGDAFSELGETIGSAFIPVIEELLPAILPFIAALGKLIQAVLPILIPLLRVVAQVLGAVATAIAKVVDWLAGLIKKLGDAIGTVGRFLDSINPLKGLSLPSLPFTTTATAGASSGPTVNPTTSSGGSGGSDVTLILDGEVFGRAVLRANRTYARRNARLIGA